MSPYRKKNREPPLIGLPPPPHPKLLPARLVNDLLCSECKYLQLLYNECTSVRLPFSSRVVVTGVRQGCLLSPSLFNLFLEFVMKDLQNLDSGIQMGEMRINNIRYADDTTLMDLVFKKLQISTNELEKVCSRWEMKINPSKCKSCHKTECHKTLNDAIIDKVDDFVFLGSNVPSVVADVKRRTRLAAWAFGRLKNAIWTNQDITRSLKVRIYIEH